MRCKHEGLEASSHSRVLIFIWDKRCTSVIGERSSGSCVSFSLWTLGFDVCAISSVREDTLTPSEDSRNWASLSFWLSALCFSSTSHFMFRFFLCPTVTWRWRSGIRRWEREGDDLTSLLVPVVNWTSELVRSESDLQRSVVSPLKKEVYVNLCYGDASVKETWRMRNNNRVKPTTAFFRCYFGHNTFERCSVCRRKCAHTPSCLMKNVLVTTLSIAAVFYKYLSWQGHRRIQDEGRPLKNQVALFCYSSVRWSFLASNWTVSRTFHNDSWRLTRCVSSAFPNSFPKHVVQ